MPKIVALHQPLTLDEAVRAIHGKFADAIAADKKGYSARIVAGQMLRELRKRIEVGEAGAGVEWWPWYESKFVRSRKDAEKVMALASAEDPEAALEDERESARLRMRDLRAANVRAKNEQENQQDEEEGSPPWEEVKELRNRNVYLQENAIRALREDIVDHAFRLVEEMNAEQKQRFVAKLKEYFKW